MVEVIKAGKTPDLNGFAIKFTKRGGVTVVEWLVKLINPCVCEGYGADLAAQCLHYIFKKITHERPRGILVHYTVFISYYNTY